MVKTNITAAQLRAARSLLGWSQADLAKRSLVSRSAIADIELGRRVPQERTITDLVRIFQVYGITFIDPETPGQGRGVRFVTPYWPVADFPVPEVARDGFKSLDEQLEKLERELLEREKVEKRLEKYRLEEQIEKERLEKK
jgi:transcriptional regulator with XRE-family HTH domain